MIKNEVHIHFNFIDPKIRIYSDFRVFVWSPILKSKNPEITEILQIILRCENVAIGKIKLRDVEGYLDM